MENQGNTALNTQPGPARYDVAIVDPDPGARMRLSVQLSGASPSATFDAVEAMAEALSDHRPTVVVFGPGLDDAGALHHVQWLARTRPNTGVVLAVDELTTDVLQSALRSGVRDVVALADDAQLAEAVARVGDVLVAEAARAPAGDAARPHGKLIASFSTKGGVGKSVIAVNLAADLARRTSGNVFCVDADLQFGDVAVMLRVPPKHSVIDAAASVTTADEGLMESLSVVHEPSGLRVLAAPIEPSAADQIRPAEMIQILTLLQQMSDYVVVDLPPQFDDVVLATIEAADEVLLVASMDIPSIKNLKVGMQTLDLLSLAGPKLKLVLNRANAKVRLDVKEIERALDLEVKFPVPSDIAVPQAVNRGIPVIFDSPKSGAAQALVQIGDYYAEGAEPRAVLGPEGAANGEGEGDPKNDKKKRRRMRRKDRD
ncbi:MAG: AAA family ATPase [Acidimicrobiia bacterium]|nr:AAA family ATPase [Acidimicrobiia bacterium]